MSQNDHFVADNSEVITGSLGTEDELDRHLAAIKATHTALKRGYQRSARDHTAQVGKAAAYRERSLRGQVGAWAADELANSLADVVEMLLLGQAPPKLVERVAEMADDAAIRSQRFYDEPLYSPEIERLNIPINPLWVGARAEGEELD